MLHTGVLWEACRVLVQSVEYSSNVRNPVYLLFDSSCTQTQPKHSPSCRLLSSSWAFISVCVCNCLLSDPNRSIFGGNSLSDMPKCVSLNITHKHTFHCSGLFSLSSSDIWTASGSASNSSYFLRAAETSGFQTQEPDPRNCVKHTRITSSLNRTPMTCGNSGSLPPPPLLFSPLILTSSLSFEPDAHQSAQTVAQCTFTQDRAWKQTFH